MASVGVDDLAKVTLLIQKSDPYQRHAQIARGFHLIAGHVAQPAGIDGQRFAESEFHAEVGNAAERRVTVRALKPCLAFQELPLSVQEFANVLAEFGVAFEGL